MVTTSLLFQATSFGIAMFTFTLWVQPWIDEFDASRSQVMTVILVMSLSLGVVGPFAGKALDRYSIKHLIMVGSVSLAGGLWLVGQATALWQIGLLYGTLMVGGLSLAGPLAAQKLAAKWFNARRGTAIGISTVGTSLGGIALPLLVGWLLVNYEWRFAHEVLAYIVLATLPLIWWGVENSPEAAGVAGEPPSPSQPIQTHADWNLRKLITNRTFLLIVAAVCPIIFVTGAVQQNLAPYSAGLGIGAQQVAFLVAVYALVMVGGKIVFGVLADRVQHRVLLSTAIAILFLALVFLLGSPSYTQMVGIVCLFGMGAGGLLPLLGTLVAHRFGADAMGQVMGLLGPFTTLAAAGPLVAGYLRDTTGSYDAAWYLMMGIMGIALVATLLLGRDRLA